MNILFNTEDMKLSEVENPEVRIIHKNIIRSSTYPLVSQFVNRSDPFPSEGWDEFEKRLKGRKRALYVRFMRSKYLIDLPLYDNRDYREFMEPMDVRLAL